MRICVLTWTHGWGGLESHAVDLIQAIHDLSFDPVLVSIGDAGARLFGQRLSTTPVVTVSEPGAARSAFGWYRVLRKIEADACIFEKGTLHTGSASLEAAARLAFSRLVTIEQLEPPVLLPKTSRRYMGLPGLGVWWYRQRLRGWLRSLAPHKIVCITDAVRVPLQRDYLFAAEKCTVIHNGIDLRRFSPATRGDCRDRLGLAPTATVFGTACRLVPQKGVDVALRAFRMLLDGAPDANVAFVVAGDGPERDRLQELTRSLGLASHVRFLGFLRDTDHLLPAIDVFLAPSRIEAQGIVVLEALASGCAVLASNVGGIPELLCGTHVFELVPPEDTMAWATAMKTAAEQLAGTDSDARWERHRHVATHFDARVLCRQLVRLASEAP